MRRHRAQFEIRHIMALVAISAPVCAFVAWLPNPGRFVLFAVLCYLAMFVATLAFFVRFRRRIDTPEQKSGSGSRGGPTPPGHDRDRPGEGEAMRVRLPEVGRDEGLPLVPTKGSGPSGPRIARGTAETSPD
jgi:hypothetical protein